MATRISRTPIASEPSPSAQFDAFVSRFPAPPETIALVKKCLPKIRKAVPCSHEVVYNYAHQIVVSFGMSDRGYEAIVALAILPDHLKLYFDKSLPDPKGLLEGKGGKVRSVTIKKAADLDLAEIQALFKAAIKNAGGPFPPSTTRSAVMIIRTAPRSTNKGSKKKSSKKKALAKKTSKKLRPK